MCLQRSFKYSNSGVFTQRAYSYRIVNKVHDSVHDLSEVVLHLFVAAFACCGDGHQGSVAVLPVGVLQHLRCHGQDQRKDGLAAQSTSKPEINNKDLL